MNTSASPDLLIMAAGMGSRYGGIKQIDSFGPGGETIMDYSIYDALHEGFSKVIFVIRKDIDKDFHEVVVKKIDGKIPFEICYQELEPELPEWGKIPRTKPWGTCHAILSAAHLIERPIVVINADDFYGRDAYRIMAEFFHAQPTSDVHAMAGYRLKDTLSPHGSVSRGVCSTSEDCLLVTIQEHTKIEWSNGHVISRGEGLEIELNPESYVSMNFWGFQTSVVPIIEKLFTEFVRENRNNPKAEFYIPLAVDFMIHHLQHKIHVIPCKGPWFGVTYQEDRLQVSKCIRELIAQGEYPERLY